MKLVLVKLSALSVLIAFAPQPAAAARFYSLYLDGVLVEQQEKTRNGYFEFSLPRGAMPESFRLKPGKGVTIARVLTSPQKTAKSVARELAALADREGLLHDRLKALSVREDIFRSAAKSQSAKTPRRTRTNPEPLASIRQGTDYAIAQLESVYQSKRKAEKELAQLAEKRNAIEKDEAVVGTLVKVWVTPLTATVTASWQQSDLFWTPVYQLRIAESEEALLALFANGIPLSKGESARLHLSGVQTADSAGFVYKSETVPLKQFPVKLSVIQRGTPQQPLTLSLVNTSLASLPPGDMACFQGGVYMGKSKFQGADAGKMSEIICNSR